MCRGPDAESGRSPPRQPGRAALLGDGAALLLFQEADPGGSTTTDVAILGGLSEGGERLLGLLLLKIGDPGQELQIRPLLAAPVIIYFWKVIVWDKVLGLGTTDPITGMIADWTGLIITAYVGGRSIEKVARIFRR